MAAVTTNLKPMVSTDWKQVFDSALKGNWEKNQKAQSPIYRRASTAGNDVPAKAETSVDVAAKALAALWGTRTR
jgi:hypothetical protein